MSFAAVVGYGMAVPQPENIVTNEKIAKKLGVTSDWIMKLTGIRQRYIAPAGVNTSDLAIQASQQALDTAGMAASDLDLIVVCTSTPDYLMPATSYQVQAALGADRAGAVDLNAACSGFVYGLNIVASLIQSSMYQTILIIGADLLSRWVDWQDPQTCILFGDGAGALVMQASNEPGFISCDWGADGSRGRSILIEGGGARHPPNRGVAPELCYLKMNGRQVFRFAVNVLKVGPQSVMEKAGLTIKDIALVIPHQANLRILRSEQHGLPPDKVFVNIDRYGNTSAATIPTAICDALQQGRIRTGDNLCLVGFGGGLGWAASILSWTL